MTEHGISASSEIPQQLWAGCPTARLPPAMAETSLHKHEMQKCPSKGWGRDGEGERAREGLLELSGQSSANIQVQG